MIDRSEILVAFDLDDTLYKECDYVASGYRYVANELAHRFHVPVSELTDIVESTIKSCHPFDRLHEYLDNKVAVKEMVEMYREHNPMISLPGDSLDCLTRLSSAGYTLALITDGRHVGQWNKIRALVLERFIDCRLISVSADVGAEKNDLLPWQRMEKLTPSVTKRWYIGDNPEKDFFQPNRLGWKTVMLQDNGLNIHSQSLDTVDDCCKPLFKIDSLCDLESLIESR